MSEFHLAGPHKEMFGLGYHDSVLLLLRYQTDLPQIIVLTLQTLVAYLSNRGDEAAVADSPEG